MIHESSTNPEQLFAAAWSARFIDAMRLAAGTLEITLPAELAVDAEVDLFTTGAPPASGLASTSACPVWSATLPICWSTSPARCVRIHRLPEATSI